MSRLSVRRPSSLALLAGTLFGSVTAMAYEEPAYSVVDAFEEFEIRRYEPYIVAEATVNGDFESTGNLAFNILAGYIFGDNQSQEKMKMTAPVTRRSSIDGNERTTTYQFVMERKYSLDTLPLPTDPRVTLIEVPERIVAARRYTGRINERNYQENLDILLTELAAVGIQATSEPQSAVYNGPFILPFLRRNEVLIDVDPLSIAVDATAAVATSP
ncbi:MAG: heme-binding protein [Pseudomonadota bacterium]